MSLEEKCIFFHSHNRGKSNSVSKVAISFKNCDSHQKNKPRKGMEGSRVLTYWDTYCYRCIECGENIVQEFFNHKVYP